MTSPFHSIKRKTEDAFSAIITSLKPAGTLTGYTHFKGFSGSELSVPRIEIICDEAEAEVFGDTVMGNFYARVLINTISHAKDTTRADHQSATATVEDVLMRDDVVSQLNSAGITDFTAFKWPSPDTKFNSRDTVEENVFKTEFSGVLYAKPS